MNEKELVDVFQKLDEKRIYTIKNLIKEVPNNYLLGELIRRIVDQIPTSNLNSK